MEMIKIINENKIRKQEINRQNELKRLAKKEKVNYLIGLAGYIVATIVFVEIVTLLVK